MTAAAALVEALRSRHLTVATGESLTAGWVGGELARIPGCSDVFRGGVVAYSREAKGRVLGLTDEELSAGIVSEVVAGAMARRAALLFGADVGLGTTGAAGPEPHGGAPVGRVCLAVWWPGGLWTGSAMFGGDRDDIRRACVEQVLAQAVERLT